MQLVDRETGGVLSRLSSTQLRSPLQLRKDLSGLSPEPKGDYPH